MNIIIKHIRFLSPLCLRIFSDAMPIMHPADQELGMHQSAEDDVIWSIAFNFLARMNGRIMQIITVNTNLRIYLWTEGRYNEGIVRLYSVNGGYFY